MESLDISKVRAFLQRPPTSCDELKFYISRCTSWEQIWEIHTAKKNQFNSPEDFLRESLMNTDTVNSPADAEEELDGFDAKLIKNRKASAMEIRVVYSKLSPLSTSLPWRILIRDAIILFEEWNIAWLFIETYGGNYVSAKWQTSA